METNQDLKNKDLKQEEQIKNNFKVFIEQLPELLKTHKNEYALMKDGKIIDFFKSLEDTHKKAEMDYKDGIFSIQHVKEMPIDLGYFSCAMPVF